MNKFLRCAAVAAMAIGFSLPAVSQADAASVVLVPLINNVADRDDLSSIYFDRAIEATKLVDDIEILDNSAVDKALEKNTKVGVLPDEAALKEIAFAVGADYVVAMEVNELERRDITMDNGGETDLKLNCSGNFVSYDAINGKFKKTRVMDDATMPLSVGARYDVEGEMFANNVTRQIKRALNIKKLGIQKPRISASGLRGNR